MIARKRLPDRPLRGAGARAAQLRHRSGADGSAILAGRRAINAHRHRLRLARDQQRPLGVVRRRARADGLPDFRPDALFAATWPLSVSTKRSMKPEICWPWLFVVRNGTSTRI